MQGYFYRNIPKYTTKLYHKCSNKSNTGGLYMEINNIPQELKNLNNWVLWRLEDRNGKPTKIPYQINQEFASSTKRSTWESLNNVLKAYKGYKNKYNGIGFCFTKEDGITGIDLDHCINDGVVSAEAQYIIDSCDSYTERSQSGNGVHILIKGYIPKAIHKDIEVYSEGRYFVITGDKLQGETIEARQNILDSFHKKYNYDNKADINTRELLDKAFSSKNGSKIKALYEGSWQGLSYESQSEADQALCNYLAFWLNKDFNSIDEAFKHSGLYREDKWNRKDYKANTINNAISSCGEAYQEEYSISIEEEFEVYDFSDLGICKRFKNKYKDILKYAVDSKYYYSWDNKKWCQYDDELPITTLAIEFIEDLVKKYRSYVYSLNLDPSIDKEEIKKIEKTFAKLKGDRIINVVSNRYKSFADTHIKFSILDKDIKYINCNNGVIDTITGDLLEHDKGLYITKIADVDYIPGQINKVYKEAVGRLFDGDPEEVEAFEILLGYMLSGKANLKTFPIIHGVKNSGKSKIFEIILKTLGNDYVKTINKSLLMKRWDKSSNATPELAELKGVRFTICSETNDNDYFDTDFIKKIVGGDTIKARPLYKPPIEFRPIFTPVIYTNGKPNFQGNDDALVNRLTLIELLYPLENIDSDFEEKILKDKTGVFSYLINLIVKFNESGSIKKPLRWEESQKEYMKDNNIYLKFKEIFLSELEGHSVPMQEIHEAFEKWFIETQSGVIPTRKRITTELKKLLKVTDSMGYPYARSIVLNITEKPQSSYMSKVIPYK
jgi:putative DNA primase/helicase